MDNDVRIELTQENAEVLKRIVALAMETLFQESLKPLPSAKALSISSLGLVLCDIQDTIVKAIRDSKNPVCAYPDHDPMGPDPLGTRRLIRDN